MRYTKWLKLGAVGAALLLIPRRSSRLSTDYPMDKQDSKSTVHPKDKGSPVDNQHAQRQPSDSERVDTGSANKRQ